MVLVVLMSWAEGTHPDGPALPLELAASND
jgi:hypothetical protein